MNEVTIHGCKSWCSFFQAIVAGEKTHDLRKMDRDFRVGDFIILKEYDHTTGKFTGNKCVVQITFITSQNTPCAFSSSVLEDGYCILSIKLQGAIN